MIDGKGYFYIIIIVRWHAIFTIISSILLLSCASRKTDIIIAGSTSVQPFIEKIAEQFMEQNPDIVINVQGGGSTAGIQATMNKTCQIGASSRDLKPSEESLIVIKIAMDGIAVIVHKDNPIDNLSIEEIRDIFAGKITNWKELDGMDKAIIAVTREEGSGTRGAFEEMVMAKTVISDACLVQDSNGAVREIIATTLQGIGYISVGLVDERVKALAIDRIKPTHNNLIIHRYRFMRPFLLLLKEPPTGNVKKYIDYTLSSKGQGILKQGGLIPIKELDNY